MSRCPPMLLQYTILAPDGDQDGCTASPSTAFRGEPPAASTTYKVLSLRRDDGSWTSSVAKAICFPSGDQAGSKPASVTRRTDSPVAPATKMPPSELDT